MRDQVAQPVNAVERRPRLLVSRFGALSFSPALTALVTAWPTVSSTVLFGVLAVLYGPMGSSVRTVVLVKDSSTVRSSSTAARALY